MGILATLFPKKTTRKPQNFCSHDWQKVDSAENSEDKFPQYAAAEIARQLTADFSDLLVWSELVLPVERSIRMQDPNYTYVSSLVDISPKVYVCLRCMKYKSDLDGKMGDRIKEIYSDFYKQNLSRFIHKSKKIKLTLTGVTEISEGADQLDSLNVVLREFGQLHVKEKELLAKMRLI